MDTKGNKNPLEKEVNQRELKEIYAKKEKQKIM